jgi:S-formylglutathione hydrolase FrmB
MSTTSLASAAASGAPAAGAVRVVHEEIESAALAGNRHGDPTRRLTPVILPPSYDRDPGRRYPVIYVLAAFTGTGWQLLSRSPLAESLDERIARLCAQDPDLPEFITVLPDCFTALGGSQYVNSPGLGRYEDHVVSEIVPHIDRRYRTLPLARHRGVVGRSSGGIGALWLAMNHPEVFGAVGSHAGDGYFRLSLPPELNKFCRRVRRYGGPEGALKHWLSLSRGGSRPGELFDVMTILASAAAYSPDPDSPLGFRLPVDWQTAALDEEVFARWLRFDPIEICSEPRYRDALASMRLLFLDAGTRDEYYLDLAARRLASRLGALGIRHTHEEFDDGHMSTTYRFDRSLPLLARALS